MQCTISVAKMTINCSSGKRLLILTYLFARYEDKYAQVPGKLAQQSDT